MANYVIGDVQGCFDSLTALLKHLNFNQEHDVLWFAGDLVNRGPKSLETLQFISGLGDRAHTVLGNHDLHLLALWCQQGRTHSADTIEQVVQSPQGSQLVDWLRAQPLALPLPTGGLLVHAGILPNWSHAQALAHSAEVQHALNGPQWLEFMSNLYGNKPNRWHPDLQGHDRLRLIVNVFTRMRMLRDDGKIDLKYKLEPQDAPADLKPWFAFPRSSDANQLIVFGHWSTLGTIQNGNAYCLDTGCVWGGKLTALRLEDRQLFQVDAVEAAIPSVP